MQFNHVSVLLEETIEQLNIKPDGIYVDGTLGGGGHSYEICSKLDNNGRLIGIDQDEDALKAAKQRLEVFQDKVTYVKSNYSQVKTILDQLTIEGIDGIVLDLGVSSYQLDNKERGFTYREDVTLDMRMNQDGQKTAKDVVNYYDEFELYKIIRDYGEDKFAKNIAKHIVRERQDYEIETTGQLIEIIKMAIPMKFRATGGHPAKKTFQAIRIEVNSELDVLKQGLKDVVNQMNDGGRICIITFHSLEDRIVKNIFREFENPCTCPANFPVCVCHKESLGKVVTRKPILPTDEEITMNKRSKSAKLRVFQRIKK